jgi:hypothetical protein
MPKTQSRSTGKSKPVHKPTTKKVTVKKPGKKSQAHR